MLCNIFGGADIADYSKIDVQAGMIAAADRGYIHCRRLGIENKINVLIGDFDSIESVPENVPVIKAPCEKDDTDMMLAVRWAMEKGCTEFRIYGGLGGRMGHTAANIQVLLYMLNKGCNGVLIGDSCDIELMGKGSRIIDGGENIKYLSLFSVSEKTEAVLTGLKYSGRVTFTNDFPLGVSNETVSGQKAEISVKSGILMIIYEKK